MNLTELTAVIVGTLGSAGATYFAYRRGQRAENAAADNSATALVYSGYGGLLERIQKDNADLRLRDEAREKVIDGLRAEMVLLKNQIAELRELYHQALADKTTIPAVPPPPEQP